VEVNVCGNIDVRPNKQQGFGEDLPKGGWVSARRAFCLQRDGSFESLLLGGTAVRKDADVPAVTDSLRKRWVGKAVAPEAVLALRAHFTSVR